MRLDHVVVLVRDKRKAAQRFAQILNVTPGPPEGRDDDFVPVRVNEGLGLFFMTAEPVVNQHLAFVTDDATFDGIRSRLQAFSYPYGDSPDQTDNGQINHPFAQRGLFWTDPDGILFEVTT
jgi:catechol 2,3-dioxygenase-like lactoylglutathione lyase family enzyme